MSQIKQTNCQVCFKPLSWQIYFSNDLKSQVKLTEFHIGTLPCRKFSPTPFPTYGSVLHHRETQQHTGLQVPPPHTSLPRQLPVGYLSVLGCTCWRKVLTLGEQTWEETCAGPGNMHGASGAGNSWVLISRVWPRSGLQTDMPPWSGHLFIPRLEGRGREGRDNGRQEQSTLRGGCWGRNPSRPGLKKYLSSTLTILKVSHFNLSLYF